MVGEVSHCRPVARDVTSRSLAQPLAAHSSGQPCPPGFHTACLVEGPDLRLTSTGQTSFMICVLFHPPIVKTVVDRADAGCTPLRAPLLRSAR
jgi:hypothetical protein